MTYQMRRPSGRSGKPVKLSYDHPTLHGWVEIGKSEIDDATIFQLDDIAQMKCDVLTGQWIGNVLIDNEWVGFKSAQALSDLTTMLKEKHYDQERDNN